MTDRIIQTLPIQVENKIDLIDAAHYFRTNPYLINDGWLVACNIVNTTFCDYIELVMEKTVMSSLEVMRFRESRGFREFNSRL